jgi:hypothetical protein
MYIHTLNKLLYLCYDMFYILWFSPEKDLWNANKLYCNIIYSSVSQTVLHES